jgi:hypothetical protein
MKDIARTQRVQLKETTRTTYYVTNTECKVGKAGGKGFRKGDLTLYWDKVPTAKIYINSAVLKNALLNSKDFLRTELGLEVKDLARKEFFTPEIVKEEVTPIEEPIVVQNPKPKFTVEEPEIVEPVFGVETKTPETMTLAELKDYAKLMGIEIPHNVKKAELLGLVKGE